MPGLMVKGSNTTYAYTHSKYTNVQGGTMRLNVICGTQTVRYGFTDNPTEPGLRFKVGTKTLGIASMSTESGSGILTRSSTAAFGNDWKNQTSNGYTYSSTYNYNYVTTARTISAVTSYGYTNSTSSQMLAGNGYWEDHASSASFVYRSQTGTMSASAATSLINYTSTTKSARTTYQVTYAYVQGGTYHTSGNTKMNKSATKSTSDAISTVSNVSRTYTWNKNANYGNPSARVTRTRRLSYSTTITGGQYGYNYNYAYQYSYYETLTTTSSRQAGGANV